MTTSTKDLDPTCQAKVSLTDPELRFLNDLPDAMHEVEPIVGCELEVGHTGPHHGLGQTAGSGEAVKDWWMRWTTHEREVVQLEPCEAEEAIEDGWICELPDRHAGLHSFELRPPVRVVDGSA